MLCIQFLNKAEIRLYVTWCVTVLFNKMPVVRQHAQNQNHKSHNSTGLNKKDVQVVKIINSLSEKSQWRQCKQLLPDVLPIT